MQTQKRASADRAPSTDDIVSARTDAATVEAEPPRRAPRLAARIPTSLRPLVRTGRFAATKLLAAAAQRAFEHCPGSSESFGPPRHFAPTLKGYAREHAGEIDYIEIYGAHEVSRYLPISLPSAMEGDNRIPPEFLAEQRMAMPAAGVAIIANGRVLTTQGSIIAPPDTFVADVSDAWTAGNQIARKIFLSPRLPPVTRRDETVAVLTTHCSPFNYGHWMCDTIPRLHLLAQSGIAYDRIVVPDSFQYHRETLALVGVPRERMITARDQQIEARHLVVPTFPGVYGEPPAWACRYLRERFLRFARPGPRRRVLVSRNKPGAVRRILNEDALFAALEPFGFERIFPEDLSFPDEISLFHNAEIVIGALGAGMMNTMWCQPGTAIIELFNPRYISLMTWVIANHLGLRYACALGGAAAIRPLARDDRGIYDDVEADIDEIFRLFLIMCAP
jgi:capsular polysaccharide biosynthesis protein